MFLRSSAFALCSIIATLDYIFIIVFTVEYLLRIFAAVNRLEFLLDLKYAIDLAAILPFYVETFTASNGALDLRFLRLFRVFRVFKLSRYGNRM